VLFSTIAPDLRIKYYPTVTGILLPGARDTPYFGKHKEIPGLPPEILLPLWEGFDVDVALQALESMASAG
jgi:hypothetical protein